MKLASYSAIATVALPAMLAAQTPTGTIVSANMTAGTASVVDVATGELRATYETGEGPHEVVTSEATQRVAIVNCLRANRGRT